MSGLERIRHWLRARRPRGVRRYLRANGLRDLLAGATLSVVDLPQSMAFALIAGVPPQYGIYASIVIGLAGSLFTSSRYLSAGPTNTQSLLVAAIVSRVTSDPDLYLELVIGLTLIKGLLQLAFAVARMGRMVRYVSASVMTGFTAAAGVLILVEQLPPFLGLEHAPDSALPGALGSLAGLGPILGEINPRALAIGGAALAIMLGARRVSKIVPAPLIAVVSAAVAVAALGYGPGDLPLVAELPRGLPAFSFPEMSWPHIEALLPGALALAVLGMIESVAIAKALGQRAGQRVDADREFLAQGVANTAGGLLQCIPGSTSFTRTALLQAAGARSRWAGIFGVGFNVALFLALAPLARYIPLAALAAVLFVVAGGLVNVGRIRQIVRTSRADAAVCASTFAAAMLLPLSYAIYVGIFLNIGFYLRQAARLHLAEVELGATVEERPMRASGRDVVFLQLEGDLFFAVADELSDRLTVLASSETRAVVIRLKRTHYIDATVLFVIDEFVAAMHARGGHVLLCGVRGELSQRMGAFGLIDRIGADNVFEAMSGVFEGARRALSRARDLIAGDSPGTDTDEAPDTRGGQPSVSR